MVDIGKTYEIKKGKGPKGSTSIKYKITKKLANGIVIAKGVEKGGSIITTEDSFNESVMSQAADEYTDIYNQAEELYNEIKNYSKAELINEYMKKDPFGDEDTRIWLNGKDEKDIIRLILKQRFDTQGEDFFRFGIKEDGACAVATGMAAMGPAPTPALGHVQGTTVNGVPVEGKSVKRKKKTKKNEAAFSGIVVEQEEIDNFDYSETKKYFKQFIQQKEVYVMCLKDKVKIVGKTWDKTENRIGKDVFFLLFKHLEYLLQTAQGDNVLVPNNKDRKDDISGWYYLYNTVLFGQNLIQIKMDIAQEYNENKAYYIRRPQKETTSGTPLNDFTHPHVGRNVASNNIIKYTEENVNDDLQIGKEYDLTPYFHITIIKTNVNEGIEDKTNLDFDNELIDLNNQEDEVRSLITKSTAEENELISSYLEKAKKAEEMGVPTLAKLFKQLADEATVHTGCLQGALSQYQIDDIDHVIEGDTKAQELLKEDVEDDIIDFLDDELQRVANFKEKYEEISGLLAKQLDRMNFVFANTEDIIYKKEGAYKYLIKFDNENGILKFKVSQGDSIIIDKEWKLEEGQDISPIFKEIEDIYGEYGI